MNCKHEGIKFGTESLMCRGKILFGEISVVLLYSYNINAIFKLYFLLFTKIFSHTAKTNTLSIEEQFSNEDHYRKQFFLYNSLNSLVITNC